MKRSLGSKRRAAPFPRARGRGPVSPLLMRAADEIAEARRLSPDGRYLSIARLKQVGYLGVPKVRTLFETIYLDGYRKAGVPEE